MSKDASLSLVICTWNRPAMLDQTLTCMHALRPWGNGPLEMIAVDNNSTDDTAEVIARHAMTLPLRRVFEPRQGISYARNAGIRAAQGALIVCLDDDVTVRPDFLLQYRQAAERWPRASFFGGPIEPAFGSPAPAWTTQFARFAFEACGGLDLGPEERPFLRHESPYGANMAYRATALPEILFDPAFGRVGGSRLAGEESLFVDQLSAAGHHGIWAPGVPVRHHLEPDRLQSDFICHDFYCKGRTAQLFERKRCVSPSMSAWRTRLRILRLKFKSQWERFRLGAPELPTSADLAWMQGYRDELRKAS